eukprot:SAG11_NODE_642_length_8006_cov_6.996965_7_plen_44_part_00
MQRVAWRAKRIILNLFGRAAVDDLGPALGVVPHDGRASCRQID